MPGEGLGSMLNASGCFSHTAGFCGVSTHWGTSEFCSNVLTESNGAFRSGPSTTSAHCRSSMPHRCTPNVSGSVSTTRKATV